MVCCVVRCLLLVKTKATWSKRWTRSVVYSLQLRGLALHVDFAGTWCDHGSAVDVDRGWRLCALGASKDSLAFNTTATRKSPRIKALRDKVNRDSTNASYESTQPQPALRRPRLAGAART